MNYRIRARPGWITIGGQSVWVDSQTEGRFITWLEENGFSKRWKRPETGLHVGLNNYTPDVELSIQLDGKTHRALVEVKPHKDKFTPYVSKRMRGVAKHYHSELLLLFVSTENAWYRIDNKTGSLTPFATPTPGEIPILKLYSPLTKKAPRIYSHQYVQRFSPILKLWTIFADLLETIIILPIKPNVKRRSYPKKRSTRRRRNNRLI